MDLLKNIFKGDKVIWIIFLMLCLISIIEVFSASSTLTYQSGDHWGPITRHLVFLAVGTICVCLIHNLPYQWFSLIGMLLLPISVVMLIAVMFMGRINNAARWIEFAGIQFQPSEFAKMAVVIVTAFILSKGRTEDGANPKAFKHILIIAGVICGIILPENFSTAFLLFGVVILMMYIGHVKIMQLAKLFGSLLAIGIVGLAFLIVTKDVDIPFFHRFDTWRARIEKFVDNKEVAAADFDTDKDGQVAHARIAVATSHVIGKGPGNSVQRDFLSQAFSDFIFAIVIEELGLLGGAFVVFLYICLLIRVGRIAKRCNRSFPAFLVIGIGLLLVTQAIFNMMVAVGLAPVTGQPLPLISRGGTSTIINCVYIGMLLSVSRYTASIEEEALRQQAETAPEKSAAVLLAEAVLAESQAQSAEEPTSQVLNNDSEFE